MCLHLSRQASASLRAALLGLLLGLSSFSLAAPEAPDWGGGAHPSLPAVDGFPAQALRLIVYTSPGGLIDVTARRFARLAQEYADHPVAVINRPGGGGIVAFEEALREPADGHRLLAVTRSNISKMVASGREDLIDRIHWHAYIMDNPHVLITNAHEGPASWQALSTIGRDGRSHQLWLGVDIGGVKHVSGVKMAERAGVDMRWIPYGSGGEAVAALLGNLGTAYLGNPRDALTSDKLKVVAVAAAERLPAFPEAPTFAELGIESLEDELIWRGLAMRKEVPDEIRNWHDQLIRLVLADPRWISAWENEAVNLQYRDAEAFAMIIERDREEFRGYLGQLGLLPAESNGSGPMRLLGQGPGLVGMISAAGLLLLGLAVVLPRTRARPRTGELMLLAAISCIGLIKLTMMTHLPDANPTDPIGASGIPRFWMLLLLPLAVWQIGLCLRNPKDTEEANQTRRLISAVGLFAAYLLLMPIFGYLLTSAVYLPAMIIFLGYRRWPVIIGVTLTWLTLSELIFQRLLMVDLPRGWLWF